MITFLRRFIMLESRRTGVTYQVAMQRLVEAIRAGTVRHDGDRPRCPICQSERTTTVQTMKNDALVVRFHRCEFCSVRFKSVGNADENGIPEPLKKKAVSKIPKNATRGAPRR